MAELQARIRRERELSERGARLESERERIESEEKGGEVEEVAGALVSIDFSLSGGQGKKRSQISARYPSLFY